MGWQIDVFRVEPLGLLDWALILVGTASVLLFAEVWRQVRLRMLAEARAPRIS